MLPASATAQIFSIIQQAMPDARAVVVHVIEASAPGVAVVPITPAYAPPSPRRAAPSTVAPLSERPLLRLFAG